MNVIDNKDVTLTPISLIKSLGVFDLDVCGLSFHKTATRIIELPKDGLKEHWDGRVWCNPPYSNPYPWLDRLSSHKNGVALVLASTETRWFQDFILNKECSILFLRGRPKFTRMDYSPVALMRGVVLVAYGEENEMSLPQSKISGVVVKIKP